LELFYRLVGQDKEKDMNYQFASLIVNVLTLAALLLSVFVVSMQIRKQHEWNRRRAAQDLTQHMIQGDFHSIRWKLGKYAHWYEASYTYADVATPENKEELDNLLKVYLSYFEGVALGIKHHVYDEDIAYEYFGAMIPEVYRWAKPYIDDLRRRADEPTIFIELITTAQRWQKKNTEFKKEHEAKLNTRGKSAL